MPQTDTLDNFAYTPVGYVSPRWPRPNFQHLQLAGPLVYKSHNELATIYRILTDHCTDKKKIKFSLYIGKFKVERLQSHI